MVYVWIIPTKKTKTTQPFNKRRPGDKTPPGWLSTRYLEKVMNKKILIILIALIFITPIAYGKAIYPEPGTVTKYQSQNGVFTIEIKIIEYTGPDISSCEVSFKKNNIISWVKEMPTTPGFVTISNSGNYFIFGNWGWYDEGYYKSVSIYNGKGEALKTIEFDKQHHIFETYISEDGNYFLFPLDGLALLYIPTQTIIWDKKIGTGRMDNILMSTSCDFILLSRFDYKSHDISFYYLSRGGNILWNKTIEHGHEWKHEFIWLSDDGHEFKYYNKHEKKWFLYENTGEKIMLKNSIPD